MTDARQAIDLAELCAGGRLPCARCRRPTLTPEEAANEGLSGPYYCGLDCCGLTSADPGEEPGTPMAIIAAVLATSTSVKQGPPPVGARIVYGLGPSGEIVREASL